MKFIDFLREHFPVLFSPQFWGIFATATLIYLKAKGWIDELTAEWLATIFGISTTVGFANKMVKKIKTAK